MFGIKRLSLVYLFAPILIILSLMLVLYSCSEQPIAIDQVPEGGDLSGIGEIDPDVGGSFLLGSVADSTFARGYIEVWAMDVAYDPSMGIVSFDVQLFNKTEQEIPAPIHFVITDVIPRNIAVVEFDGVSGDGFPFYDFSSKLGDDNVLDPGERTERVTMKFHTAEPRSFAIGFRIDLGPPPGGGIIAGVVYRDDNQNGMRDRCDRCEPGIQGITVALEKTLDNGEKVILFTRTDLNGEYSYWGLKEGVYKVFVNESMEGWVVTSTNPLLITLVEGPDGKVQDFFGANFGLFPIEPPVPGNLFGPIMVGPLSRHGTLVDSVFINPPSVLPVIHKYYLDVMEPPFGIGPFLGVIDSASAWINDELVFEYVRTLPPDSTYFRPQTIELPDGLVKLGENTIRLLTTGNEHAVLMWRVYKEP